MASSQNQPDGERLIPLLRHLNGRLGGLRIERYSWWVHWRELAEYILPRRYRWLVTPNELNRGVALNQRIIDSTGTVAARICAAGMMSGITSPGRPWFTLQVPGDDSDDTSPIKLWLTEVEARMQRVMAQSNYYVAKATQYFDLTVFGTAPMLIYEDPDPGSSGQLIRCFNPCAGEYYLANSPALRVNVLYREFTMSVAQMVEEFGLDALSDSAKVLYKTGGAAVTKEFKIGHAIEPNDPKLGGAVVPKHFPWRECFWQIGESSGGRVLRLKGFHEQPFSCPRWDLAANDAYGRSPGMDALGDIKQLQLEQRRKAQGIDKMVNPPLVADMQLKNQPATSLPGGVTYVQQLGPGSGMRPLYEVQPRLIEMMQDIAQVQARIKSVFFNDLFMMISNLDTVRTATEIDARREEKLVQLGPVLERFENESLDPDIERIFSIMARRGLLPPAPAEIHGAPLQVRYVSMLAQAQRAASTSAIERLMALVGNLQAVDPNAIDNIDVDELVDEYADLMGVSPKIMRATAQVMQMRQQKAQAQQEAAGTQQAMAAVQGAQVLSHTDVGGGQNALAAMLGNAPAQQAAA